MRAIVILLVLGALTAGCPVIRVYEGDKRPKGEVAVIFSDDDLEINGRRFYRPPFNWAHRTYEVLPGVHTIGVRATGDYSGGEGCSVGLEDGGRVLLRLWDGRRIEASVTHYDDKDDLGHFTFRTKPVDLQLRTEAGHIYDVREAHEGFNLWIWIMDGDSKEVVAGVGPAHEMPRGIKVLRRNAGLSDEDYRAELRVYDPPEYRTMRIREITREMRQTRRYVNDARPIREQLTPELRREYDALPWERSYWPVYYQLYRARRLAAGATEAEVLGELRKWHPLWYESLERGWGEHLPDSLRAE